VEAAAAAAPSITTQPSSESVYAGGVASFAVVASGTSPLSYQWNMNGAAIPGAQNPNYILSGAQLADNAAKFTVTVSNIVGKVTSGAATLTVNPALPAIIAQPQSQSVIVGSTATFVVIASGSPPLHFQWLRNGVAIAGATGASYITPATSLSDSGSQFDVVITNPYGTITSAPATLTVGTAQVAPTIVEQPQNVTTNVGGSASFSVVADGTQPFTYQWYANGVAIAGATGASYTVAVATVQDNQISYTVTVSNAVGSATSQAAVLTVTVPPGGIDLIAGQLGGSGNIDGLGSGARFYSPETVALDAAGDVFVADTYNSVVREITPAGAVTTIAGSDNKIGYQDGVGTNTLFNYPQGIALDANGNIYVADTGNQVVRKITSAGVVSTLAGQPGIFGAADGPGATALFAYLQGLATDAAGNVYVADSGNNTIRMITPAGVVSTLAGTAQVTGSSDGVGPAAQFNHPDAVALDAAGNIYVADTDNFTIRVIDSTQTVTTLAGTPGVEGWADGTGAAAEFDTPSGLAVDIAGNIFVADTFSGTIRMITPAAVVTTVAGSAYVTGSVDGTGGAASFNTPWDVAVDSGDNLYVADFGNHTIRKINPPAVVSTLAGLAPHPGSADGTGSAAQFDQPQAAVTDGAGNMYIADTANNTIRVISAAGVVKTLAGTAGVTGSADGTGPAAQFNSPQAITLDSLGNLYVADTGNNTIRKITSAGIVTTLAGTAGATGSMDGIGASAQFNGPQGLATDAANNIYVADTVNDTIRLITPDGVVTTLAGTAGTAGADDGPANTALFANPVGLAFDSLGNLYIADSNNYSIRVMSPQLVVSTFAGNSGVAGTADGTGNGALFNVPTGIAVDLYNDLYVMDSFFRTIRKVTPAAVVTTVAGYPNSHGVELGPLPGSFNNPIGIASLPGPVVSLIVPDKGENAVLQVTLP
jgi:sugar lactone lactonase YvrE